MKYYEITDVLNLEGEEWKTHPVYTEYEGSTYGRVRAKERHTVYNWGRRGKSTKPISRTWASKIVKQHKAFNYLSVQIRCKPYFVQRFICECWCGMADGMHAHHINEDKYDNRPNNLKWVTVHENHVANNLQERRKPKMWKNRKGVIYVYCVGNRMVKITETLQSMGDYLGVTIQAVAHRIKHKTVDKNGGHLIKVHTQRC